MEMENDGNMFYMEYTEEPEYRQQIFNQSLNDQYQQNLSFNEQYQHNQSFNGQYQPNQSFNGQYQQNQSFNEQYQQNQSFNEQYLQNQSFNEQYQQNQSLNEHSQQNQLLNEEQQEVEHEDKLTTSPTTQTMQPLHKLNKVDTDAAIRTEIKQIIAAKISEEISSKVLEDVTYEMEDQISSINSKTESLQLNIEKLDKEVETDDTRLAQSEKTLQKTVEVIGFLKENLEKQLQQCDESCVNELWNNCLQLHERSKLLKKSYMTKSEQEQENQGDVESVEKERNDALKLELSRKREALKNLKLKQEQFTKTMNAYDDAITKNVTKKRALEEKLVVIKAKKEKIEQESLKEKEVLEDIIFKKTNQTEKFKDIDERKINTEKELGETVQRLSDAKQAEQDLARDEQILEKTEKLNAIKDNLGFLKQQHVQSMEQLQEDHSMFSKQLNEKTTFLDNQRSKNDQLSIELNNLNSKYIQKCEEKFIWINKDLERQNAISAAKLNVVKQQKENEVILDKLYELQNRYDASIALLNSLENAIMNERNATANELELMKLKFEKAEVDHNKYFTEMKKKKEYLLVNSKFLEDKSKSVYQDVTDTVETVKALQEENADIILLVENKSKQLDEAKSKLVDLNKTQSGDIQLKPGLKSTENKSLIKKVQFNELLSFKSPTSSELSNPPGSNATQSNTSVQSWVHEVKGTSDVTETLEEEF